LAADLVVRNVAVIAADWPAIYLAKAATSTTPIIFWTTRDPIEAGFVASYRGPDGN
jgi:putative tryptophan/tyrosine transport system substrate-binding protein